MGFWRKVRNGTAKVFGKTTKVATNVIGEVAAGVSDAVSDDPRKGAKIRQETRKLAEKVDGGTQATVKAIGTGIGKVVEAAEKGTVKAVETARPHGRKALSALNEAVTNDGFAREFEGFDPPLHDWTTSEANAILDIWNDDCVGYASGKPIRGIVGVKSGLEHYGCNAVGLLATRSPISYAALVKGAAKALKVGKHASTTEGFEVAIISSVWHRLREQLSPEDFGKLQRELQEEMAKRSGTAKGGADVAVALTAAQLSGFGVFLAASTILGGATSLVGVTLPFAVYTGMSSTIATVIGPAGFAAAGLIIAAGASGKNWDKVVPFILYIRMLRESRRQGFLWETV